MKTFSKATTIFLLTLASFAFTTRAAETKPNIIIILTDDLAGAPATNSFAAFSRFG